jgi:signal transduction histidine kinase
LFSASNHILRRPPVLLLLAAVFYLLSFLFGINYSSQRSVSGERNQLEHYLQKKQREFLQFTTDTALIKRLAQRSESVSELHTQTENITGVFIFKKYNLQEPELSWWSNQYTYPPEDVLTSGDGEYFKKTGNGLHFIIRHSMAINGIGDSLVVIGMVPVLYEYFVKSIPPAFAHSKSAILRIQLSENANEHAIKSLTGKILFYISAKAGVIVPADKFGVVIFRLLAVCFLLIYIQVLAEQISKNKGGMTGILFLFGALLFFRLLIYFTAFPLNLRQFELFDPGIYASGGIHRSLGDLLINASLFCWFIYFAWQKTKDTVLLQQPGNQQKLVAGILALLLILTITFTIAYIVHSLAADSSISFDVINFFSLSGYSVFGFITLSVLGMTYYYFMRIMIPFAAACFKAGFYFVYLILAFAGLSFLTFQISNPLLIFYIVVLIWLLLYTWLQRADKRVTGRQKDTMAGALFWIFIFSVSLTAIIIDANREKEWEQRKSKAYRIDLQSDPISDLQLSISFTYLDRDFLESNFHRFRNEASAALLRDSILRGAGFLNKYDSRIYVFDENKNPLYNDVLETYSTLDAIYRVKCKVTEFNPDLFYYETTLGKFNFLYRKEVTDKAGRVTGYFFVIADPVESNIVESDLYPDIFTRAGQPNPEESQIYSYGIYQDGLLVPGPFNKYSFATKLEPGEIPTERITKKAKGDFVELWYKASGQKLVVIARKKDTLLEAITLFSYIFCVFLLLVGFLNLVALLLRVGGNISEFRRMLQWNIRTQVHTTIIFISIFSFIIIGIATISFFIKRYDRNNEERLSRTMEIVVKELEKKLDDRRALDDQLAIYDSVENSEVQKLVNEISEIHNVDVNVYDTSGNLQVTSQPVVYRDGFLSKKIHPMAFYYLNKMRWVQQVQQEKISEKKYLSIYSPLRGKDGIAYAYINIPYFLSQSGLKQEISNFLVAIINLNAFIFLVAGIIAVFITNRVTRSFSFISEKMQEVNLGKNNEEIIWKRDDEIGELVREYNKMVKKLEVSAAALARSEREGAWREMARQVAHEIKNPLTPMKLSIQYLQKSIDNNTGNVKELTANVANTLVEQIDHLSKIAFDFSQFANIGNTNTEIFDINEVIASLENLYKANTELTLSLKLLPEKIYVRADKTQMNRLFTNLIQNAIEACSDKEECRVKLGEVKTTNQVRISIEDNGTGISKEMQSKIFIPNFTTKTSGTGLGLAMCKGIVEQAGGRIWFETSNRGSIFYVELPLAG